MYDMDLLEHKETVNKLLARCGEKFGINCMGDETA